MKPQNAITPARVARSPFSSLAQRKALRRAFVKAIEKKPSGGCWDTEANAWVSCAGAEQPQGAQPGGQQQAQPQQQGQAQGQGQEQEWPNSTGSGNVLRRGVQAVTDAVSAVMGRGGAEKEDLTKLADNPGADPKQQKIGKVAKQMGGLLQEGTQQAKKSGKLEAIKEKLKKADEAVRGGIGALTEKGAEKLGQLTGAKVTGAEILYSVISSIAKIGDMFGDPASEVQRMWAESTGIPGFAMMVLSHVGGWALTKARQALGIRSKYDIVNAAKKLDPAQAEQRRAKADKIMREPIKPPQGLPKYLASDYEAASDAFDKYLRAAKADPANFEEYKKDAAAALEDVLQVGDPALAHDPNLHQLAEAMYRAKIGPQVRSPDSRVVRANIRKRFNHLWTYTADQIVKDPHAAAGEQPKTAQQAPPPAKSLFVWRRKALTPARADARKTVLLETLRETMKLGTQAAGIPDIPDQILSKAVDAALDEEGNEYEGDTENVPAVREPSAPAVRTSPFSKKATGLQ